LHPKGVDFETDSALAILKGVEDYGHGVILLDVFAAGKVGADEAGMPIETDEDEVESGFGASDPDFGILRGGRAIGGLVLNEVIDVGQALAQIGAWGHVLEVAEGESVVDERHFDAGGGLGFHGSLGDGGGFCLPWRLVCDLSIRNDCECQKKQYGNKSR